MTNPLANVRSHFGIRLTYCFITLAFGIFVFWPLIEQGSDKVLDHPVTLIAFLFVLWKTIKIVTWKVEFFENYMVVSRYLSKTKISYDEIASISLENDKTAVDQVPTAFLIIALKNNSKNIQTISFESERANSLKNQIEQKIIHGN